MSSGAMSVKVRGESFSVTEMVNVCAVAMPLPVATMVMSAIGATSMSSST